MNIARWLDRRESWWKVFVVIFAVSVTVVGYIGYKTYQYAPPVCDFVDESGKTVFSGADITAGQKVFLRYGLMEYGSFLGDGAMRGPDFTAEALHQTALSMNAQYDAEWSVRIPDLVQRKAIVEALVQKDIKENRFKDGKVTVNAAQAAAFERLRLYYSQKFGAGGELAGKEVFKPENYITDQEKIRHLTAFFYWGGWLCSAKRPGYEYSYTHNWPYDPLAGNVPHGGLVMWSVIGTLVVILTIGVIFYYYGRMDREAVLEQQKAHLPPLATSDVVDRFKPTPTQRATYKFFAVAALLFLFQVTAGLLAISDFVNLVSWFGFDLRAAIPVTISRMWHSQFSVLWIAVCWFAATIWVMPLICRPEPRGQLGSINLLFAMLATVAAGAIFGIPLGIHGKLDYGDAWRWFGLQGWEFMQIGRAFQAVLYSSFVLWLVIITRGVWPALKQKQTWSLPNWMVYSIAGIIFMFSASWVASPDTNFVIADFWRWCTIHMWVEAFFELFTTIIVAYFLYLMGFVSHLVAARVVYLSAVLFLGSGMIGISHNFYWNAKSIETIALGGVLSSLQVAPLVLLTIEAWRFRHLPQHSLRGSTQTFGLGEAFLFLVGVNFWNFLGAGVMGFMINLPIVNYYQHGTYLTVNHGHAALMGVYGNLAVAAMLFCSRWNVGPSRWNAKLLRTSFWSLNAGLMFMVVFDLFPVGIHQLAAAMNHGYAYARSQEYLSGTVFQTLTWLRGIGVAVFVTGGVLPLTWFMVTRWFNLKPPQTREEQFIVPPSVLAVSSPSVLTARGVPDREPEGAGLLRDPGKDPL
ncbi:MAG: cbb3-type cytochrome c oxidase subunit I [Planctomycetota bacterium]